ncbi:MAG TPA: ThiF family adenylyltransferase [Burkholderiales bacterium]|nr:ThiF family adenylyltransferase [Burkholderiales bacterium]
MDRFDRNIRFFGADGQAKLRNAHVAVAGCGGLGQHVIQQLAFLGVSKLTLIEDEALSRSNLNRYILARHDDPIPGTHKIDNALRAISAIDPSIEVTPIRNSIRSREAFEALRPVHSVFGCFDNDGARLILNEYAKAYSKEYYDLASDIEQDAGLRYGGRVVRVDHTPGCLVCLGHIDLAAAREDLESDAARRDRAKIYGVDADLLDDGGPSVVSINGVVASLGATEYVLSVTGIRSPKRLLTYRGDRGIVTTGNADATPGCYFCETIAGTGASAAVERYIITAAESVAV